jgi:hypothetical protein
MPPPLQIIRDLETLWEVPQKPKGVLFVAHGCSHQGSDFWQPSARCKHCLGLPEECLVREVALQRGYAVVAVTSFNRTSGCWHNTQAEFSEDLQVGQIAGTLHAAPRHPHEALLCALCSGCQAYCWRCWRRRGC